MAPSSGRAHDVHVELLIAFVLARRALQSRLLVEVMDKWLRRRPAAT